MVLLMVLLIFSIVAILATSMIERQSIDLERISGQLALQQAREFSYAAEQAVRQGLYMDWEADKEKDHLGEEWAVDRSFPLEPGAIFLHLSDIQGRFNLNSLAQDAPNKAIQTTRFRQLLNLLGLDVELATEWANWLNPESQADDRYLSAEVPYRAAYQDCKHTSELLLIENMDAASYSKLEPYVACLPVAAQLNVNTAPAIVLASLDSELTLADGQAIVNARGEDGFSSVDDFWALSQVEPFTKARTNGQNNKSNGDSADQETDSRWRKADFSVRTEYFELFSRIDLGARMATLEAVIHRAVDTGIMTTLYRDFSRRESRPVDPVSTANQIE
jgi:general secretion pathway protein K